MAVYEVELTARARKQYKALDPAIRGRIRALATLRAIPPQFGHRPAVRNARELLALPAGQR